MKQTIIIIRKKQILMLAALVIIILSCSQSTEPGNPPFKDPREMTWTVDTLHYPGNIQTMMSSIAVCTPEDIWICGHADGGGRMWHYNGADWSPINMHELFVDISDYNALYIYDCNNIFLAGAQGRHEESPLSKIIKYDGANWIDMNAPGNVELLGIDGDSPDNIWACGREGVVLHYDGTNWETDTARIPVSNIYTYFHKDIAVYNGEIFLITSVYNTITYGNSYYFLRGNLHNWTVVDSLTFEGGNNTSKWGDWGFSVSEDGNLYSFGSGGVFRYEWDRWNQILNFNSRIESIYSINENYLIAVGDFGNAMFYDGTDWYDLTALQYEDHHNVYTAVWTDGYQAYVIGYTLVGWPMKTVVWHGR